MEGDACMAQIRPLAYSWVMGKLRSHEISSIHYVILSSDVLQLTGYVP